MKKINPKSKYAHPKELQQWIKEERDSNLANRFNAIRLRQLDYSAKEVDVIIKVDTSNV